MTVFTKRTNRTNSIKRVLWIVLILNVAVALAKIAVGIITDAESIRADGIHSIFDGTGNVVGLIGMALAMRPADEDHPYGHSKFETTASIVIGFMLLAAAYEVGWGAIQSLMSGENGIEVTPLSFIVMVGTLIVNLFVTNYERRAGKKYGSAILGADAKHTASDAMVSISVIIGLIFVACGFPIADSIAALIVTVAIFWTAISVFRDANETLSDKMRINPESINSLVMQVDGIEQCHHIRTRGLENEIYTDLHILVDPEMSVREAHDIGNEVEKLIAREYPYVKEVMVHIEPAVPEEFV